MQCRSCGENVGETDRFCNACGARLGETAPTGGESDGGALPPPAPTPHTPPAPPPPPTDDDQPQHDRSDGGDETSEMPLPNLYDFADEPDPQVTHELAAMASRDPKHDESTTVLPTTPRRERDPAATATPVAGTPGSDSDATAALPQQGPTATDDATSVVPATGAETTGESTAVIPTTRRQATGEVPATYQPMAAPQPTGQVATTEAGRPRTRLRFVLVMAVLTAGAGVAATLTNLIEITTDASTLEFLTGTWKVNDFGTNSTVAVVVAAVVMVVGGITACFGYRWGAGLAGGAGLAIAGWSALIIGLAEVPLAQIDTALVTATEEFRVEMTRDIGYVLVLTAGVLGILTFIVSLGSIRRDRATTLNPWVAALGAAATLVAAVGPLLPEGSGLFENNWSSIDGPVDFPTLFFAGRLVQLAVLGFTGLVGFLLVRRYGLGLAAGGFTVVTWYAVTALFEQTASPIGPANGNPGSFDTVFRDEVIPHAMTIGGLAVALFCLVMAGFEVALSRSPTDRYDQS